MGCALPFDDDTPFEEKVKCLADEELLEIWVESQQAQELIKMGLPPSCVLEGDFEQTIVTELFVRSTRRLVAR